MSQQSARKIGFFTALSICFTSIVGIGIFLKNASVGKNVEGNGVSWLLTWIISGILAILLAYHFGKISRIESSKNLSGLSGWIDEIATNKDNWFKKIVSINYGYFYNPILAISLSFFCSEFLIMFIETIIPNIILNLWAHSMIALCFTIFFVLNNYFSIKFSGYISVATSILKFIPLFLVIFIGIFFANVHNLEGATNGFDKNISFDKAIQGIMLSMPSVLFAFDSFIGVGAWSKDIKGGHKKVPKVIITAMILVTIIYSAICLASIFHYNENGDGTTIINVLIDSLPQGVEKGIKIFISLFIFISAFGTANSIFGTCINEYKNAISNKKDFISILLSSKDNSKKMSLVMAFIVISFWFLVMSIPSIILNTDAIIDGFSNIVVIFMFLIYSYIILLFWKSKKREGAISKGYTILSWITIISVMIVVSLNVFYVFLNGIQEWNKISNWGLFLSNADKGFGSISNLDVLIFYIVFGMAYITFPFINSKIVKQRIILF